MNEQQRKAMKLALEAYELEQSTENHGALMCAIKEALAQPEQEPVAQQSNEQVEPVAEIVDHGGYAHVDWKAGLKHPVGTKFYTTPPQRTWVGLTDEQIVPMFSQRQKQQTEGEKDEWYFYAWGVSDGEAAHGIKE